MGGEDNLALRQRSLHRAYNESAARGKRYSDHVNIRACYKLYYQNANTRNNIKNMNIYCNMYICVEKVCT